MFKTLKYDLPAGLAVFLVAVPLCLGIAVASGTPLISGLIAGIIGGIIIGLGSNSKLSVSGPAAGLVAVVVSAIGKVGFEVFLAALVVAGLLQIILGVTGASKISKYIPTAVIKGMLAAIGMTLILKQLPAMLGAASLSRHAFQSIAVNILIIGILSLLVLIGRDKWFAKKYKSIPGSLVAVIIGIIISLIYHGLGSDWILTAHQLVNLPTNIHGFQDFWQAVSHPSWSNLANTQFYIVAITIALVASIETILSIHAIDKMDPAEGKTSLNREMVVQGTGNMISGMLGGLPITSVIIRSSVNLNSGAKSQASSVFHGLCIVIALLFAATYINMIPMGVLAAILVYTGYHLTSPSKFIEKYKAGRLEFIPFVVTFVIVIVQDLLVGVLTGVAVYYIMRAIQNGNKKKILAQIEKDEEEDLKDFED